MSTHGSANPQEAYACTVRVAEVCQELEEVGDAEIDRAIKFKIEFQIHPEVVYIGEQGVEARRIRNECINTRKRESPGSVETLRVAEAGQEMEEVGDAEVVRAIKLKIEFQSHPEVVYIREQGVEARRTRNECINSRKRESPGSADTVRVAEICQEVEEVDDAEIDRAIKFKIEFQSHPEVVYIREQGVEARRTRSECINRQTRKSPRSTCTVRVAEVCKELEKVGFADIGRAIKLKIEYQGTRKPRVRFIGRRPPRRSQRVHRNNATDITHVTNVRFHARHVYTTHCKLRQETTNKWDA